MSYRNLKYSFDLISIPNLKFQDYFREKKYLYVSHVYSFKAINDVESVELEISSNIKIINQLKYNNMNKLTTVTKIKFFYLIIIY